jgi:AraC-like DNA-binding protein
MPSVIAMIRNSRCHQLVSQALEGHAELRNVPDERDLRHIVRYARPTAVLLERRDARGFLVADHIRAVRSEHAAVRVLICTSFTPDALDDVMHLGRCNPTGVVLFDLQPLAIVREKILGGGHEERASGDFDVLIASVVHPFVVAMLRWCLERVDRETVTVSALAEAFDICPEALARKLKRAGVPSPRALIAWARLLSVARRLEDRKRGVDAIALEFQFGSGGALRGQLMRYTGMTPTDLRDRGAVKTASHLFAEAFAATTGAGVKDEHWSP